MTKYLRRDCTLDDKVFLKIYPYGLTSKFQEFEVGSDSAFMHRLFINQENVKSKVLA